MDVSYLVLGAAPGSLRSAITEVRRRRLARGRPLNLHSLTDSPLPLNGPIDERLEQMTWLVHHARFVLCFVEGCGAPEWHHHVVDYCICPSGSDANLLAEAILRVLDSRP
jgi:hypothetical protein